MVGARAFCSFFASLFLHQVLKAMQDLWEAGGRAGPAVWLGRRGCGALSLRVS
jgi:hypothetical protein